MFYHTLVTSGIKINCGLVWKPSAHLHCFYGKIFQNLKTDIIIFNTQYS